MWHMTTLWCTVYFIVCNCEGEIVLAILFSVEAMSFLQCLDQYCSLRERGEKVDCLIYQEGCLSPIVSILQGRNVVCIRVFL